MYLNFKCSSTRLNFCLSINNFSPLSICLILALFLFYSPFCFFCSMTAAADVGPNLQLDTPPTLSLFFFFPLSSLSAVCSLSPLCRPPVIKAIRRYYDSAGVWVWSPISVQLIALLANYPPFKSKSLRLFLFPIAKC